MQCEFIGGTVLAGQGRLPDSLGWSLQSGAEIKQVKGASVSANSMSKGHRVLEKGEVQGG